MMTGFSPQGCVVTPFKKPAGEEVEHDFLWRVHHVCPRRGEIAVFNRSHYEDVLVVRVHELVKGKRLERRYETINHFERHLVEEGTHVVKFFLWISRDEQKRRLRERLQRLTDQLMRQRGRGHRQHGQVEQRLALHARPGPQTLAHRDDEIGRASCRERV